MHFRIRPTLIGPARQALVAGIIASLVGIWTVLAPATATAAPVQPDPQVTAESVYPGPYTWDDRRISSGRKKDLAAASSIFKHAVSKKRKTLNYVTANKYDKGRVTARRKFAAGYWWAGGRITHISKAELAKVKTYRPKHKRPRGAASFASTDGALNAQIARCTSRSAVYKHVNGSKFYNVIFYNSCETKAVIDALNSAALLAGVVALVQPEAAPLSGAVAALLVIGGTTVSYYADISEVNAIVVNDHWHIVTIEAQ